ncbi:hypothetical protein TNCT_229261, partial [Trichonephila clavata]
MTSLETEIEVNEDYIFQRYDFEWYTAKREWGASENCQ